MKYDKNKDDVTGSMFSYIKTFEEMSREQKNLAVEAVKLAWRNPWMSGAVDIEEGDPMAAVEYAPNISRVGLITRIDDLIRYFKFGNWGRGSGVVYENLCFLQQVNGGDEWKVTKNFPNGSIAFESISFEHIITDKWKEHPHENGADRAKDIIRRLQKATRKQCEECDY